MESAWSQISESLGGAVGRLRTTVRGLLRAPGYTLPTVLILAGGLGASSAIFSVVDGVLLEPLPFRDSERLVVLCESHESLEGICVGSVPTVWDLSRTASSLTAGGTARGWAFSLKDEGGTEGIAGGIATPEYFQALGVQPALGRLFSVDEVGPDHDDFLILSFGLWANHFGSDSTVVGRWVRIDDEPVVIIGVLPQGFEAPELDWVEAWRPMQVDPEDEANRGWRGFRTVARLAPGVSLDKARAEIDGLYRNMNQAHDAITGEWRMEVRTLKEEVVGDLSHTIMAFFWAVGLLLLIGCANVANLVFARGIGRQKEMAIRASLGATRISVLSDIALEGLVIAILAGGLGGILGYGGSRMFLALAPPGMPRLENVGFDGSVIGFTLLLASVSVGLVGLLPSLRLKEGSLSHQLGSGQRTGDGLGNVRLRRSLVAGEMALSVILLFGAILLARTFNGFLAWDPGFDREGLVVVSALASTGTHTDRPEMMDFWRRAEIELGSIPGVSSPGTASSVPLRGGREFDKFHFQGGEDLTEDQLPTARWFDAGPTYFETLGLPILRGRGIDETDTPDSPPVALVNETLARTVWPESEPVGKWIEVLGGGAAEGQRLRVVGVVPDIQPITPGERPEPEVYWSNRQFGRWGTMFLLRVETGAGSISPSVIGHLQSMDPTLSLGSATTLEQLLEGPLARPRFNLMLAGSFAVIAIILAALGLYSVLSYTVAQSRRTVGLRIALGSSPYRVMLGILREGIAMALIGVMIGTVMAVGFSRVLASLVHGVSLSDPTALALTAGLLILLAFAASGAPAYRASREDPARLLRDE